MALPTRSCADGSLQRRWLGSVWGVGCMSQAWGCVSPGAQCYREVEPRNHSVSMKLWGC